MKNYTKAILVAAGLGVLAYFLEALIDWLFFFNRPFFDILIWETSGHHLFMRLLYVGLIMIGGGYAVLLLSRLQIARERESHIKRVLLAIRNVNRLITHEKNQTRLLDETCRLLVETQGLFNAWIILLENGRPVEPFYHKGFEGRFGEMTRLLLSGQLPLCGARVLAEMAPQIISGPCSECGDCPNRPDYYPERSAMAIPLQYAGHLFGWLTVSVPRDFAEDPEGIRLLSGVAHDIAFALDYIQAARALEESQQRYREIFQHMSDGVAVYEAMEGGRDFIFKDVNPAVLRGAELNRQEVVGRRVTEVFPGVQDLGLLAVFQRVYRSGQAEHLPVSRYRDDRVTLWVENYVFKLFSGEIVAVYTDLTGRKEAEEAYSRIYHLAPDLICVADIQKGTFLQVNPAFEQILGYTEDELLGRPILDFIHPDDVDRTRATYQENILKGVNVLSFENRYRSKDGSYHYLDWNATSIPAEGVTFAIGHDITERKQAEAELRESEAQFRSIYNTSADGILIFNLEGEIVAANPMAEKLYGYDKNEMAGLSGKDIVSKKYYPVFQEFLRLKENENFRGDSIDIRKDGSSFHIEVRGSRFRYQSRPHLLAIVSDVTDRKQAEAERERLLSAVEQSREIFIITDAEGTIQYVNPAFTTITGYLREETLGQNPRMLKSGEQDAAFYEDLWQTISNGRPWQGRFVNKRKDGSFYTEEATISPVRDAFGQIVNYVGVKHDITQQLRVHNEKLQLEAQFQQAQKLESIGRLAGGVAHDLNNLLSPIIGYSEILLDDFREDSEQKESIEAIIQAGMRARDLVNQLLAFSRKQVLDFQPVDMNQILTWFEKLLRRAIREDVAMEMEPAANLPLIRGDAGQLEQVIMNLVVNAQDAMPDGGTITIETREQELTGETLLEGEDLQPGKYVLLRVRDTGSGMDPGIQEHLFEPFFTTKTKDKGTGLGLATAYGIVKQHGGEIRVSSQSGQGSVFDIFLPVAEEEETLFGELTGAHPDDLEGGETILLVEDNEQVRQLSRAILQRQGYTVIAAENGEQALASMAQHEGPVHLLLTDVIMPKMSGRELFDRIARNFHADRDEADMKVLYMSGYADDIIARHGVLEEGVNFIQKPFSVETLAVKVREVLNNR